ncbi:MAG: hypothetical protein IKA72_01655 [Clostridia bacterium]|nr:hypothetical protein [Clostridia bacterium]
MRKSILSKIYTIAITVAFVFGQIAILASKGATTTGAVLVLVGVLLAFIVAPMAHEAGHVVFAKLAKMQIQYVKFFCFSTQRVGGKYALTLINPFLADQTQVIPTCGGNMQKRAEKYTVGGLVFSGILVLLLAVCTIVFSVLQIENALTLGMIPYSAYLFFLNAAPFEYADGKTDCAVYSGLKRGDERAKTMLSFMEIQGRLFEDTRYSEISEELFNFPVLAEDEPMFLIGWDLKYRRALDEWDLEKAAACMKRMSQAESYFTAAEREKFAAELTYLHALSGNFDAANACSKYCEEFLKGDTPTAKRILATVAFCANRQEDAEILKQSGLSLLENMEIYGEKKLEESLLGRINFDDLHTLKKENDYERTNN